MAPLATVEDLEARIGPLNDLQLARADALLEDASAIVREDTQQVFEEVAADVVTIRPVNSLITLPRRPVSAINSVTAIRRQPNDEVVLDQGQFSFDGIDTIRVGAADGISYLFTLHPSTGSFRVNYDHGPTAIPPIVKAVICGMVNRVLTSPSLSSGLTQETIGQYGYQMQQSVGTQGTEVRYTDADRRKLRRYRRANGTVLVRS